MKKEKDQEKSEGKGKKGNFFFFFESISTEILFILHKEKALKKQPRVKEGHQGGE